MHVNIAVSSSFDECSSVVCTSCWYYRAYACESCSGIDCVQNGE